MTAETPRYYLTTPIYYANDVPHIGHAYTTLACDMIARFKRLDGQDVFFLTGTDEHGQKVQKSAEKAGVDPLAFCDTMAARFQHLNDTLNISADRFIRTTEAQHIEAAQALWRRLEERGHIYLDSYAGWYSVRDEAFYQEKELIDGPGNTRLAPTGAPVEWVEELSYFFDLSRWQEPLLTLYHECPDFVLPKARLNEVKSFVGGGLKDLSISRTTFDWGVPVPGADGHVMYVWIDALTNYLTGVGFPDQDSAPYQRFWPADLHMIGKDILRFHAVYWPAFLMAAELPVPRRVFAHGWWTNEGQKISKSLGNVIDPFQLVEEFGLDPVRYFLMREVPFGQDGDFARTAFVQRCNADLANGLGNLAQRSLSMIAKNCDGRVPQPAAFSDEDTAYLAEVDSALPAVRPLIEAQALNEALAAIWARVGAGDQYVAAQAPWTLKKTDAARMATVLYVAAEAVRQIAVLAQIIVPDAAARLLDQLAVPAHARGFDRLGPAGRLVPGTALPAPQGTFPRLQFPEEAA